MPATLPELPGYTESTRLGADRLTAAGKARGRDEEGDWRRLMGIHPCSIKGCSERRVSRGLCSIHYSRLRRLGPLGPVRAYRGSNGPALPRPPRLCSVEDCDRTLGSKSLQTPLRPMATVSGLEGRAWPSPAHVSRGRSDGSTRRSRQGRRTRGCTSCNARGRLPREHS